ncbi:SDR family oxidoreductase [Marivirga sp.]|uniref:SDR family oxidoreductase n=1 Tax=Marivirga sp. TaxID=2018662 RepID=UPI003DA6E6A5
MNSVLIIGATSDVAISTAHLYAKKGYEILLAGRNSEQLEKLCSDIKIRYDVICSAHKIDLLDFPSHKSFINQIGIKLPKTTICFAGFLGEQEKAAVDWDEAQKIIQTNFTGIVSIINLIAEKYESAKKGEIAVLSSVAGDRGRQSNYTYGASKAGLTAYLSGLRNRLHKSNVHVLTVKPGFINTKMTEGLDLPKALTAQPEHISKAIEKGLRKKKNVIYSLWMWKYIMLIIKNIPEGIFKKLKL